MFVLTTLFGAGIPVLILRAIAHRSKEDEVGVISKGMKSWLYNASAVASVAVSGLGAYWFLYTIGALIAPITATTILLSLLVSSSLASTIFIGIVSSYTDFKFRKVDRNLIRFAILILFWLGIAYGLVSGDTVIVAMVIISMAISGALLFIPSLGASDVRAFAVMLIASFATLSPNHAVWVAAIGMGAGVAYGMFMAVKSRSTKVSIPLVPFLMFAYPLFVFGTILFGVSPL